MTRPILTVGHSNRSAADLVTLLGVHGVRRLADVRRFPRSRRNPWFDTEPLAKTLASAGIEYRHWPELGGYREARAGSPHVGLAESLLRGYADHMETREFGTALAALIEAAAAGGLAVMCAEADPSHCHRRLLADALVTRGVPVEHIVDAGARLAHRRTPSARAEGERLVYEDETPRLPGL